MLFQYNVNFVLYVTNVNIIQNINMLSVIFLRWFYTTE